MRELSKEEIKSFHTCLTVGELRRVINRFNIPDSAIIMVERVEDTYFNDNNWGIYLQDGDYTAKTKEITDNIDDIKASMDQFHPASGCGSHGDEDFLFIHQHY